METLLLTRKQITAMADIAERFSEVQNFTLEIDNTSGIGPAYRLKFSFFNDDDVNVDLTDVSTW